MENHIQRMPYLPEESPPGDVVVYLALSKSEEGFLRSGRILCLNYSDTPYRLRVEKDKDESSLKNGEALFLGAYSAEDLQEQPQVWLNCVPENKEKQAEQLQVKIQRKSLIKEHFYYAAANVYLHPLAAYAPGKKVKKEDLRRYATQLKRSVDRAPQRVEIHDVRARAEFNKKLDLHARAILDDEQDYRGDEIFARQLEVFERYMDRAIRLGVERVEIIHGIGSGRLRDELKRRLGQYKEVKSYENGYTADHKFGATVVYFS
jgi:hypothetical protein